MNILPILRTIFLVWAALSSGASLSAVEGFDVVTMRNGDIYNGRLEQISFKLTTHYGQLRLPKLSLASIRIGTDSDPDILRSQSGDLYSGKLEGSDLVINRVLAPPLPLSVRDIDSIILAPPSVPGLADPPPHLIETQSGDRFQGKVITQTIVVRSSDTVEMLDLSRVRHLDIIQLEDETLASTRIALVDGTRIRGDLLMEFLRVQEHHNNTLDLPMGVLDRVSFELKPDDPPESATLRRRFRDPLRDGRPGPLMLLLSAGRYERGDGQGDGDGDEAPPTSVQIGQIAIGAYEVTFEEYDRFCESTSREKPEDEGWGRRRRPVVNVSWDSATAYTDWLSLQTGKRYRLPSDSEWEYAARAGSEQRFWWGNEITISRANCSGCGSLWDGEKTSVVGRFEPNPFGLYDTAGNVFEWVSDCWSDNFSKAPRDGSPLEKPDCGVRVIRGGSWSFPPKEVRSANRWRDFQARRSDDTGFR
ncbi:MAG: formylglycine-generating enzyme family protein, partial [Gammaproteobacteria bacterium]|nr:formylglycine-generating enzyme family protein [Gammaproteobacteria bacterium]